MRLLMATGLPKVTVTIDTNSINARGEVWEMNLLDQLHKDHVIEIRKTDALDTELLRQRP